MNGKNILITGGTGFLGKGIVTTILQKHPKVKQIIVFSRSEQNQLQMAQEFSNHKSIKFIIGDVRDFNSLKRACNNVDYVIHAAAMKHVHLAEYNPDECIKTNIGGAENTIRAALECDVEKVVALSTDKACAPVGMYGASKLASDKLFVAANIQKPIFSVVRFGNIFGSNDSVVPFFIKKSASGTLPITHPKMTRFTITLEESVDLILDALKNAWGGEIFVPKIPSYNLLDVAKAVCQNCKIEIVGIRPGEKIHEEMITLSDSLSAYDLGKYYVILPLNPAWELKDFIKNFNASKVKEGFSYNSIENPIWETIDSLKEKINRIYNSREIVEC